MADRAERVGIVRGAASPADEARITEIVEDLGLAIVFQTIAERQLPSAAEPVTPLETISSPDDFLVKEHFDDFEPRPRLTYAGALTQQKQTASRAFNYLLDTRSASQLTEATRWDNENRRYETGQPVPYTGLIVRERTEVGFQPYALRSQQSSRSRELAHFAMQAGSLVAVRPQIAESFVTSSAQELVLAIIDQVAEQIAAK